MPLIELAEREEQDRKEEQLRVELDRPFLIAEDRRPWPDDERFLASHLQSIEREQQVNS